MTIRRSVTLSWAALLLGLSSVAAQETRIRVVQSGATGLLSDMQDIVTLTPNKNLQKQWKNLKATLDDFLIGVDYEQPILVDFVIATDAAGKPSLDYQPTFPIKKLDGKGGFLENVKNFGYKIKKQPTQNTLYELTQPGNKTSKPMFMRYENGFAIFGQTAKDVPAGLPNPLLNVKHLLVPGVDVAAEMKNEAAGAAQRKQEFEGLRKELEAAIKFKRNEEKSAFELRKLGTTQMFEEAQRFVVDAELLRVSWTTETGAVLGKGDLQLTALPGTSLLASIQLLSEQPSFFASVELHPKPVFSGKFKFPLDDLRKQQAKARHPLFREATKAGMDKREALNDEGKLAAKQAVDHLVDIFDASLEIGFDGFTDMYVDDTGKHTAVTAMRCGKAKLADDIVALLPKIRNDWKVKMKAEEHGGVTIHEISVPERRKKEYESLFSGEPILYVGTSQEAVWSACGKNALDDLKAAITQQAKPAPEKADPVFAEGTMKFGPWLKLLDILRTNEPKGNAAKTKQELQQEKERNRLRELALEAFEKNDDQLTTKLWREGDEVRGETTITQGVFRFIGSAIADFSKENLN